MSKITFLSFSEVVDLINILLKSKASQDLIDKICDADTLILDTDFIRSGGVAKLVETRRT